MKESSRTVAPSRARHALRIGLIADTHGLLRPEAVAFLADCDHVIHGGDVGDAAILAALRALAPLTAVRGNNDHGNWADGLPERVTVRLGGVSIAVVHALASFVLPRRGARPGVVISGHSHRPCAQMREGVLYVNPGSAGPRRFRLPIALGELHIVDGEVRAVLFELAGENPSRFIPRTS